MCIDISNVEFRIGQNLILQDLNYQIPAGSFTVVCGQTGSGKSTMLQLLAGLEAPTAGTITYRDGQGAAANTASKTDAETGKRIGIVFQFPETQFFAGTVQAELEYGLKTRILSQAERTRRIQAALGAVGLQPDLFLQRSPFLLSGGEKRRLAIAIALSLQPDILLLDEPTAGLDPSIEREIVDLLKGLPATGLTVVVATHDLDVFFPVAEQVILLQKGQLRSVAAPQELVNNPAMLEEAGLELPASARIAYLLRERGLDLEISLSVDQVVEKLQQGKLQVAAASGQAVMGRDYTTVAPAYTTMESASQTAETTTEVPTGSLLQRLDPRMKWLAMLLLSAVILGVSSGWGLLLATAGTLGLLILARLPWRQIKVWLRPLVILFCLLWLLSSVTLVNPDWHIGPLGISYQAALQAGAGIAQFGLILLIGLLFSETTTGAPLREGFAWFIQPLAKIGIPVRDISLAVAIILQFVPWIFHQLQQLRKAVASRRLRVSGAPAKKAHLKPQQIITLLVPLLISILKLGDELATAIESRGYLRNADRVPLFQLQWRRQDTWALLTVSLLAGMLLVLL